MSQRFIFGALHDEEFTEAPSDLLDDIHPFGDDLLEPIAFELFADFDPSIFSLPMCNAEQKMEPEIKPESVNEDLSIQCIKPYRDSDVIEFDHKIITFGALLKREMKFSDTGREASPAEKRRLTIIDEQPYIDGCKMDVKTKNVLPHYLIIDNYQLTRDAFIKRNYVFESTGEVVNREEKRKAKFLPDGVYVDDKKIIYNPKKLFNRKRKWVDIQNAHVESVHSLTCLNSQEDNFLFFGKSIPGYTENPDVDANEIKLKELNHIDKKMRK